MDLLLRPRVHHLSDSLYDILRKEQNPTYMDKIQHFSNNDAVINNTVINIAWIILLSSFYNI